MELRERTALLTGAGGGIGGYVARALAAEGVDLALSDLPGTNLGPLADELRGTGVRVEVVAADLGDAEQVESLVHRAEESIGSLDILVNNAGLDFAGSFLRMTQEELETIVTVNLLAAMKLTRAALPGMLERGGGHVVNIASVAGKLFTPYLAAYAGTKHGLVGFTHSLRTEYGSEPVGFSVVCPVFISGVGMFGRFEERIRQPRPPLSPVPPERVGAAVVKAIQHNRAETFVGSRLLRPLGILSSGAPAALARLGGRDFVKEPARDMARARGRLQK